MNMKLTIIAINALVILSALLYNYQLADQSADSTPVIDELHAKIEPSKLNQISDYQQNAMAKTVVPEVTVEEAMNTLEDENINFASLSKTIRTLPRHEQDKVMNKALDMIRDGKIDASQFFMSPHPEAVP